MRYIHLKGCGPSGAAGLPCELEGTEGAAGQAHPTISTKSGVVGGTRAAPVRDTELAPPWDGMLPANKGGVSCGLGATASQGLHRNQLSRAKFRAGCSLPQPCWEPLPMLQGNRGCSWLHQRPPFSQPKPQEWAAPRTLAQLRTSHGK